MSQQQSNSEGSTLDSDAESDPEPDLEFRRVSSVLLQKPRALLTARCKERATHRKCVKSRPRSLRKSAKALNIMLPESEVTNHT